MYVKCIDFHDDTNFNASIFTVIIDPFFALDLLMVFIVKSNVFFYDERYCIFSNWALDVKLVLIKFI